MELGDLCHFVAVLRCYCLIRLLQASRLCIGAVLLWCYCRL